MTQAALQLRIRPGEAVGTSRWRQLVSAMFGEVDMRFADERAFSGCVRQASLDDIGIAEVSSAYEDVSRHRQHVSLDGRAHHVLVAPLHGCVQVSQGGRECIVGPGQFALFDLDQPHRYCHASRLRALSMRLPTDMLQIRTGPLAPWLATGLPAGRGIARVALDFMASLLRERAHLPAAAVPQCASRAVDLAALMLSCTDRAQLPESAPSVREALHARSLRVIEGQLADPDLDPARIAAACGISTRYLHKIFKEAGQRVGDRIRERRLEVCRDRLAVQSHAVTVKSVALSTGFRSVSHFCNAFRERYGVSPSEFRTGSR